MKEEKTSKTSRGKGNFLWKYRKRLGLTQAYVAKLLGHKSTAHVSAWENGRTSPDRVNSMKLSIIYRVPIEFLFREEYLDLRNLLREQEDRLLKTQEKHAGCQ